jgi:hypothetical protein
VLLDLAKEMGSIRGGVREDHGFDPCRVLQGIFDAAPAAPGMPEEMNPVQLQSIENRLNLFDIPFEGPQSGILRVIRTAGSELVVHDDPKPVIDQGQMRITQIVAWQPGAAVQQEENVISAPIAVGHDGVATDIDLDALVGRPVVPHHEAIPQTASGRHRIPHHCPRFLSRKSMRTG